MHCFKHITIGCFILLFAAFSSAQNGTRLRDDSTVSIGAPAYEDRFIQRWGPDLTWKNAYQRDSVGIILSSFGREPLYLMYRTLQLDTSTLQQQVKMTQPKAFSAANADPQSLEAWLNLRMEIMGSTLSEKIEVNKDFPNGGFGSYINCGDPAFEQAAVTLRFLSENKSLSKSSILDWISAQDAVFAECSGTRSTNKTLNELPNSQPQLFRQLRNYQISTQHFYAGRFTEAREAFDRIASEVKHPKRAWAAHAAVRALVRNASLDQSFRKRTQEIRGSMTSREQKIFQWETAEKSDLSRRENAFEEIQNRISKILADPTLADVHQPSQKLLVQSREMLVPEQLFKEQTGQLAKFERDPVISQDLSAWVKNADNLFDYGSNKDLIKELRTQHLYFDWIRTIQGCTDNPRSPNFSGACDTEHAHALERWSQTGQRIWLLAALVTANEITAALEPALTIAQKAKADDKYYLSFRYHSIRLLRQAGRIDQARLQLKETLSELAEIKSFWSDTNAVNLLKKEGFSMSKNALEALAFVERKGPSNAAADVDEWLNRRLSSEEQLALAQRDETPERLRNHLLIAAWWRAELAGKQSTAFKAAQAVSERVPNLRQPANAYMAAATVQERSFLMARIAADFNISPIVYGASAGTLRKRREAVDYWCTFDSGEYKMEERAQRVTSKIPLLAPANEMQIAEFKEIAKQGTALQWMARIAQNQFNTNPGDPKLKPLLVSIAKSEDLWCRTTDSDALIIQARESLDKLGIK